MNFFRYADVDGKEVRPLIPVPHKIRKEVTDDDVKDLWAREALCHAESKDEKIVALSQWSVSYHKAYLMQQDIIEELHRQARSYHEALVYLRDTFAVLKDDTATTLRLLGSGCQQVKVRICGINFIFRKNINLFICSM